MSSAHSASPPSEQLYRLKRYTRRSALTFTGPLLVVVFYSFICLRYLRNPPDNDIIDFETYDAAWVFYAWFLVAVFLLDWAKTALANIEACALMRPALAPPTASHLMWHTEANWSNPLWWLRAARAAALRFWSSHSRPESSPGRLWISLSLTSFLIFITTALSGLTIEIKQVLSKSDQAAQILGPNQYLFGVQAGYADWSQQIRSRWQSGRKVAPPNGGLMYAPEGQSNVSDTYFDDMAAEGVDHIEVFVGPAVEGFIVGQAWGMWASLSCAVVDKNELRMIDMKDWNQTEFNICEFASYYAADEGEGCKAQSYSPAAENALADSWMAETVDYPLSIRSSLLVAVDGTPFKNLSLYGAPYTQKSCHDPATYDHRDGRPLNETTTALLELFLWEGPGYGSDWEQENATALETYFQNTTDPVAQISRKWALSDEYLPLFGIGLQCKVSSAVGTANLSPSKRQFSNFSISPAIGKARPVAPLQMQALEALGYFTWDTNVDDPYNDPSTDNYGTKPMARLAYQALQQAIGSAANRGGFSKGMVPNSPYPLLLPHQLKHTIYKLLGESMITMMDTGGIDPWTDQLYSMHQITYLVAGPVPWQPVLAVLCLWALIISGGALWMMFFAGPRWAPTLNGFELFKFGAYYDQDLLEIRETDFQNCTTSLKSIPGMVGLLSTNARVGNGPQATTGGNERKRDRHIIGLSESEVGGESAIRAFGLGTRVKSM